jgi:segregation and condensation protein A
VREILRRLNKLPELEPEQRTTLPREMVQQVLPLALIRGEVLIEQPKDLFIPPDALAIILEEFEGPLDLLLYLIRKQKFDILDIPIAPITTQYMEYVELMKDVKLELAAEYLVMAAILAEIKSRLLLPKQAVDDDEEDPRAELVRRLQEYEIIKNAAQELDQLPRLERDVHLTAVVLAKNFVPRTLLADVDLTEIVNALNDVIKRTAAFEHHHIKKEALSTRERMSAILSHLSEAKEQAKEFVEFSHLFKLEEGKTGIVVTFLALLELIKESLIECLQSQVYGQIQVRLRSKA